MHPLEQKLAALRRRVRRAATVRAGSFGAAVVLAIAAAFGAMDFFVRWEDRGLRIIASLAALGVLAWCSRKILNKTLFAQPPEDDLTRQVERAFPKLKDRLLSAVEFARNSDDDPTAGSVELRRAVIERTAAESQDLDFYKIVDRRPVRRATTLALAACVAACVLVVLAPAEARTAVSRLINPFDGAAWPRVNQLMIRRPVAKIARGAAFQVEVVDARGRRLPPEVTIHYRDESPESGEWEETERLPIVDRTAPARRENVRQSFSYRVEGGDDRSMPWSRVEVVDPPAIASLSIRLVPPTYSGWPTEQSERDIRALAGTEVRIAGQATTPLASASLVLDDGRTVPTQVGADGLSFNISYGGVPWILEKAGTYGFELIDRDGLRGGGDERWEIRVIPDNPPVVHLERPSANLFVTPRAIVPVRIAAKDDLALHEESLVFRRGEKAPEEIVPLYSGPKRAPRLSSPNAAGESRTVEHQWRLADLDVKPGTQLLFHATASDYRPQTGKSDERRLTVVTPDELQDRLAARERLVVSELQRALAMQRTCRSQSDAIAVGLKGTVPFSSNENRDSPQRRIERADVDRLQAAEHGQREVNQLLTSRGEGVPMHIVALLDDLETNRIDAGDTQRQLASLLDELDRLGREQLPPIESDLTAAVKTAEADREEPQPGAAERVAASMAAVGKRQDAVIASLQQWLARLSQWDSFHRIERELRQILRDQEDVTRRAAALGRKTLAKELRDLSSEDAAELKNLGSSQLDLARFLDRTLQGMDQAAVDLRQSDPPAADAVAAALAAAKRLGVAGQMRTAGEELQRNRMGQVASGQKQIVRDLGEVLDALHQTPTESPTEQLARLDDQLKKLRRRQQEAFDQTKRLRRLEDSRGQLDRAQAAEIHNLARSQRSMQADAAQLAKRFAKPEPVGMALGSAAAAMGLASQSLEKRETGPTAQEPQTRALRHLDLLLDALKPQLSNAAQPRAKPSQPSTKSPEPDQTSQAAEKPSQKPSTSNEAGSPTEGKSAKTKQADTRTLMKQLWGVLPKHAREQMLQLPAEEWSPKYESQIEEYFRRVAEGKSEKK